MINPDRIIDLLARDEWADFTYVWIRLSWNRRTLFIGALAPPQELRDVFVTLVKERYIEIPPHSEYITQFRLSEKGVLRQQRNAALAEAMAQAA